MIKAGLYVRLSDEDEGKERKDDLSESIVNQKALLINYAKEHDFSIHDIYCDDDYSGLYDDRPGFEKLLEDAKAGKFNVIIAKSQSRFTRNMEHVEHYLHQEFVELGIRFIGVVDGVDTSIESNKKARQIYGLTNEWYSEDLSKNIRAVFKTKINAGQFIGSFAPYGYVKDPLNKNHLVIDPEAADVVRRIFKSYISGMTIEGICDELYRDGISTPAVYKKQQGLTYRFKQKYNYCERYGYWATTTVRRILSNESYLGHTVQGKSTKATYKSKSIKAIPSDEWVIVKNTHDPIVFDDDFQLVQSIFSSRVRREMYQARPRALSGKLKCAECGNVIVNSGRNKSRTRTYARCQLYKKSHSTECTPHKIVIEEIEEAVQIKIKSLIQSVLDDEASMDELAQILQMDDSDLQSRKKLEKKIKLTSARLEELKQVLKSLYMDKVKGVISEELYIEMAQEFQDEVNLKKKLLSELQEEIDKIDQEEQRIKDYYQMVRQYSDFDQLTSEMVNRFIEFIEISEDENAKKLKLIIHWNV